MENVVVGVIICEAKNYFRPFLLKALSILKEAHGFIFVYDNCDEWEELRALPNARVIDRNVNPINEGTPGAKIPTYRISHFRQMMSAAFLETDGAHLFALDCDTFAPADEIPTLAARGYALSSGLCAQRTDRLEISLPANKDVTDGKRPTPAQGLMGFEEVGDGNYLCGHYGMGNMLLRRDVVEAVKFRDPDWLASVGNCEDVQYCADANAAGYGKVYLDLSLSCWHADSDGFSNHILVGAPDFVVQWNGQPFYVYNKFGSFARNSPVWDLPEEVRNVLPEEFSRGFYPRLTLEVKRTEELGICPL